MLPILNSIMNPFIYGILHRDFKHGIKRMFGVLYLKHQLRSSTSRKYNLDLSLSHCRTTRSICYSPPFGQERVAHKGKHYLDVTHESTLSHEDFFNVDTARLLRKGDISLSPLAGEFPQSTIVESPTNEQSVENQSERNLTKLTIIRLYFQPRLKENYVAILTRHRCPIKSILNNEIGANHIQIEY